MADNMVVEIKTYVEDDEDNTLKGLAVKLGDYPKRKHLFLLIALFRSVLQELYDDRYRLDIIERPSNETILEAREEPKEKDDE